MTILAGGGGGGVKDENPYFTDRNSSVTLIFYFKFNSTDEFPESWGVYTKTAYYTSSSIMYYQIVFITHCTF